MLLKSCKFLGMSIELHILPKFDHFKVPRQLPPNHKILNPPSHHENPDTPLNTKPINSHKILHP